MSPELNTVSTGAKVYYSLDPLTQSQERMLSSSLYIMNYLGPHSKTPSTVKTLCSLTQTPIKLFKFFQGCFPSHNVPCKNLCIPKIRYCLLVSCQFSPLSQKATDHLLHYFLLSLNPFSGGGPLCSAAQQISRLVVQYLIALVRPWLPGNS